MESAKDDEANGLCDAINLNINISESTSLNRASCGVHVLVYNYA